MIYDHFYFSYDGWNILGYFNFFKELKKKLLREIRSF